MLHTGYLEKGRSPINKMKAYQHIRVILIHGLYLQLLQSVLNYKRLIIIEILEHAGRVLKGNGY